MASGSSELCLQLRIVEAVFAAFHNEINSELWWLVDRSMSNFSRVTSGAMWRVIFYERQGRRLHINRSGPWLPTKELAQRWAAWFHELGYVVALENQFGDLERMSIGLPG